MTIAKGSRFQIAYIPESTYGTTPSTPQMVLLPVTSANFEPVKSALQSETIRSDRQVADLRHGNKTFRGDLAVEFRGDDFDALFDSLMMSAIATDTWKIGSTKKGLTFELGHLDTSTYEVFAGCLVNSFGIEVRPDEIVKANFGIVGLTSTTGTSPLDATPTAFSSNTPYDSFSGVVNEGGASAKVTAISLSLENNITPVFVVGSPTAIDMVEGRAVVTGSLTAVFENLTLYNKFINETESSLDFSLVSGGDTYAFTIERLKYTSVSKPIGGEGLIVADLKFQGLYDSSDATTLKIVKS
jgi:hypothetical protein